MPTFIIEHLESKLFPWCLIEYKHISTIVGKNNLWFTNIPEKDKSKLTKYGRVFKKSVKNLPLPDKKICVLDPKAKKILTPKGANSFKFFIFGGILGSNPRKNTTEKKLTKFLKGDARNLGRRQFSTDNAVYVVKQMAEKNKRLSDLRFKQGIEIKTGEYDSVILPYKYVIVNKKPLIPNSLINYIKKHQGFK